MGSWGATDNARTRKFRISVLRYILLLLGICCRRMLTSTSACDMRLPRVYRWTIVSWPASWQRGRGSVYTPVSSFQDGRSFVGGHGRAHHYARDSPCGRSAYTMSPSGTATPNESHDHTTIPVDISFQAEAFIC